MADRHAQPDTAGAVDDRCRPFQSNITIGWGTRQGDACSAGAGQRHSAKRVSRPGDMAARFGGEEFGGSVYSTLRSRARGMYAEMIRHRRAEPGYRASWGAPAAGAVAGCPGGSLA